MNILIGLTVIYVVWLLFGLFSLFLMLIDEFSKFRFLMVIFLTGLLVYARNNSSIQIDYNRVYSSVEHVCKSGLDNNDDLKKEIENIMIYEFNGKGYSDFKVDIDGYDIFNGQNKVVKMSFKVNTLFNYFYTNIKKEFTITISDKIYKDVKVIEQGTNY